MTTHARLTSHQKEVLMRLSRLSGLNKRDGWVLAKDSGAPAGLEHLYRKGYADRKEERGPRGGHILFYRPSSYTETVSPVTHTLQTLSQSKGEIDSTLLFARVKGIPVRVFCGVQEFRGHVGERVERHAITGATLIELGQRMIALNAIDRVQYA